GCSKTSVFGTATLDLHGKADIWPLFQEVVSKPTGFWNNLDLVSFSQNPAGFGKASGISRLFWDNTVL
ncbi:MAG: hypothetical protein LBK02_03460, partial [Treponema sp.]|nr:hypothetical protein [Treponema sp.]